MARKMKTQKRRKYKRGGGLFDGEMFKSKSNRSWSQYFGVTPEQPTAAQYVGLAKPPTSSLTQDIGVDKPKTLGSDVGVTGGQRRQHYSSRAGKRSRKSRKTRKSRK